MNMEKVFDVVRSWMLSCCSCSIEISRAAVVVGMNGNVVCKEKEGEKQQQQQQRCCRSLGGVRPR
jgi:hypothetical protein